MSRNIKLSADEPQEIEESAQMTRMKALFTAEADGREIILQRTAGGDIMVAGVGKFNKGDEKKVSAAVGASFIGSEDKGWKVIIN